ncbi:MAG: ATP-binding protein [Candidatus Promineifilaceae bacterium]|nr:response regulator [Anaerolineaceae bacterium]
MTTILIIEDETPIRDEVMDWLRFEGFEVLEAENGRIGLHLAHQHKPDLILCDIAMPEMNGHELLVEIRSSDDLSQTPFIFLTAAADRHAMRKGMDLGADDYLTKPFTHAEVLNAIHARLQKQSFQTQQQQKQVEMLNQAFQEERKKRLLKSRLMAMFSHDFRNPLTLILMASDILSSGDNRLTPERKQHQHDRIRGSVHLLLQMLDDMLLVAEMESGYLEFVPKPLLLANFAETIVKEFRLIDQGIHKITFFNHLFGQVKADRKLFRQILANLLSNAMKYSPPDTEITIYLREENGRIQLEVQDEGIGIPAESLPHLFEPFHRANNAKQIKGTGLGLTIVKECVDHHQGEIDIQSTLNKGSRFVVWLPLEKASLSDQPAPQ